MNNSDVEMSESLSAVAILDAGAQYGKVIDRRIRDLRIQALLLPLATSPAQLKKLNIKAVVVSGGPGSVFDPNAPNWDPSILDSGLPILGICYGMQLICRDSGGKVVQSQAREDGQFTVNLTNSPLHSGLGSESEFLLTHRDVCDVVPQGYAVNATCGKTIAGIENVDKNIYGVQYHPEVDLSVDGKLIFENFLIKIAGCEQNFSIDCRRTTCVEEIQKQVGCTNKVLSLVSGGVDSSVCTALLHEALGPERVVAVHIDNGFLRKNESEQVKESLERVGLKLTVYNEKHNFYHAKTRTPKKVGNNTISNAVMKDLRLDPETTMLAQGTLRPDLIESASHLASGNACTIKTHHNDSHLVRKLRESGRVVEPLKDFHKDEVRNLGRLLGLPEELVSRHPFPGPGLAIRILCADEKFTCKDFSETSNLLGFIVNYSEALKKPHPLLHRIQKGLSAGEISMLKDLSSKFTFTSTLLPIKTVGVQGDCRTYSYVAALSTDEENPCWDSLMKLAKVIPRICSVNRVVYVFGGSVKYSINNITHTTLTENVIATLRQVDAQANTVLAKYKEVQARITQMPVILIPVHFDVDPVSRNPVCQRSIVLRPFITNDFMTGVAAAPGKDMPLNVLREMVEEISKVPGISRVLYDLTSKPPGTTEWQ